MKILKKLFIGLVALYLLACAGLYFFQEKIIFHPAVLEANYTFSFPHDFEEVTIETEDNVALNGLLFKADSSKGLVFFLHGNSGNLASWGGIAETYLEQQYDLFIYDYRGFGKSEGTISNEAQLFSDAQLIYDQMHADYDEEATVIIGYSIGSGVATYLASKNNPKQLILQAPYYSLKDMMRHRYPIVPTFLLQYPIETNKYIEQCSMPITLFHGTNDEAIPYESSLKLKEILKPGDQLVTLEGMGHNGVGSHELYRSTLIDLLK